MSNPFRWFPVFALVLGLGIPCRAQSAAPPVAPPVWPVTSAPARFNVDSGNPAIAPKLSQVYLFLPDPKWGQMTVRTFTDKGVAVASDFIMTPPGEPAELVFDSSLGARNYLVYVGSNWPPMHLTDTKAGVWFETRDGDGKVITTLPDMLQAWAHAPDVNRRMLMGAIFEGGNRFGPQTNLLIHFQGWFDLSAAENLQLADCSVDSSFVLVDGKEVVEWPGLHERWWGVSGPPQGAVQLAAGPHVLDYYNAYVASPDGNPPIVCTLSVKGGAFPEWTTLMGDKNFFRPIVFANANHYQLQKDVPGAGVSGTAPALAITWSAGDECIISSDIADIGMIAMHLTCFTDSKELTWTFDDGMTAQGTSVTHLFLRPGLRTIHLSLKDGGKEVATLDQTISVHPDWNNPGKQLQPRPEQFADLLSRDPTTLSASDMVGCYALAQHWLRTDVLLKLAPAVAAKMNAVSDADLPDVGKGASNLAREDWSHSAEEIQLLRALIDRCGQGTPAPPAIAIASQARLALARLIYKTSDKIDDVKAQVDAINRPSLSGEESHLLEILKADMMLAAGDVPGARKEYVRLTGDPSGPDVRTSIRRTAKIGQARSYMDGKDFDAAEGALNDVARHAPIEKLSPDWALTRLRLYQEEGLPGPAYIWAKRLLPVIIDSGRSELLFRFTDLAFAQGDNDLASKTLSELLKKHPYSEEAAQAKEKWPGKE